jgi:hypothetical protein
MMVVGRGVWLDCAEKIIPLEHVKIHCGVFEIILVTRSD